MSICVHQGFPRDLGLLESSKASSSSKMVMSLDEAVLQGFPGVKTKQPSRGGGREGLSNTVQEATEAQTCPHLRISYSLVTEDIKYSEISHCRIYTPGLCS